MHLPTHAVIRERSVRGGVVALIRQVLDDVAAGLFVKGLGGHATVPPSE